MRSPNNTVCTYTCWLNWANRVMLSTVFNQSWWCTHPRICGTPCYVESTKFRDMFSIFIVLDSVVLLVSTSVYIHIQIQTTLHTVPYDTIIYIIHYTLHYIQDDSSYYSLSAQKWTSVNCVKGSRHKILIGLQYE